MFYKRRISFNRFLNSLESDYELLTRFVRRRNVLCGVKVKNLVNIPYEDLKHTIPALIKDGEIEKALHMIINSEKRIRFDKVLRSSNYRKFSFLLWVQDEYIKIGKLEEMKLKGEPSPEMLRAGVSELSILGDDYIIDSIALRYNYTHEEVLRLPYSRVFNIQLKDAIERRINKRYAEEMNRKRIGKTN